MKKFLIFLLSTIVLNQISFATVLNPFQNSELIISSNIQCYGDGTYLNKNIQNSENNLSANIINASNIILGSLNISNNFNLASITNQNEYFNFERWNNKGLTQVRQDIGRSNSWVDLGQIISGQNYIMSFCNLGKGIIVAGTGSGGRIIRSTDYGLTWTDLGQQASQSYIDCFCYIGDGIVLAGTESGGKILRSTDYGLTWTDLGQQGSSTAISSMDYFGDGVVLASAGNGAGLGHIFRSTNFGASWTDLGQKSNQIWIVDICTLDKGIALASSSSNGYILRSTDYGLTWDYNGGTLFSQNAIFSLCYLGNGICLAGCALSHGSGTGKILRSTDYGLTWTDLGQQASQTQIIEFGILGNGIVLAGTYKSSSGGHILRSTLSDPVMSPYRGTAIYLKPLTNSPAIQRGALYFSTNQTFYICTNGTTWSTY